MSELAKKPIENHKTAAWANVEKTKNISNVAELSVFQVENAKEYVDENKKQRLVRASVFKPIDALICCNSAEKTWDVCATSPWGSLLGTP